MSRRFLLVPGVLRSASCRRLPGKVHNRSYKGVKRKPDTGGNYSRTFPLSGRTEKSIHVFVNAARVNNV
ncbi:hypothetical protein D3C71_1784400 [compost metagenome]